MGLWRCLVTVDSQSRQGKVGPDNDGLIKIIRWFVKGGGS